MNIDDTLTPADLAPACDRLLELACKKVRAIDASWDPKQGTPVFTVEGRYTTRGWTEWTQGFQYGSAILAFDGTDDKELLDLGRQRTLERMAPHVTHTGVHDHGFNNLSTYGNLRRLMREGRYEQNEWEQHFYEMAIKCSGAVQASRWSVTADGGGYVYSFNGPHSLFIDTMRTLRILALAHQLGHVGQGENDKQINLLERAVLHARTTARHNVYLGVLNHPYEVLGRTAHEAIFNCNDGQFRCRSTQQGYSPFSTWTRGLAWAMLGYVELAELLPIVKDTGIDPTDGIAEMDYEDCVDTINNVGPWVCDHYINDVTATDGIPYWDDGAPGLAKMVDWQTEPANPYNEHEPVDSSAAAIAAQGLIRLGNYLGKKKGEQYLQAGLTVAKTLFAEPYLSTDDNHQGLILHSVYHRPNGWDHVPAGRKVPCDESSMWGDYHALELAVLIKRMAEGGPYLTFFDQD